MTDTDLKRIAERAEGLYHDFVREGSLSGAHLIGGILGKSDQEINDDLNFYGKEASKHA